MTIFNNIVLATADTLPVIAATPIFRLANQYLNMEFNSNSLSKNIIMMFKGKKGIVASLSAHQEVGLLNPETSRLSKPLSNAVFLCSQKIQTGLIRLISMTGYEGLLSSRLLPRCNVENPLYSVTRKTLNNWWRLSSYLGVTTVNTHPSATALQIQQTQLEEFKDAAIALCGGNAFLFLPIPSPTALSQIIVKCERLLIAAKSLQTEGGAA